VGKGRLRTSSRKRAKGGGSCSFKREGPRRKKPLPDLEGENETVEKPVGPKRQTYGSAPLPTSLGSALDLETVSCFLLFQEIRESPIKKSSNAGQRDHQLSQHLHTLSVDQLKRRRRRIMPVREYLEQNE
jgi:hypothetical protein